MTPFLDLPASQPPASFASSSRRRIHVATLLLLVSCLSPFAARAQDGAAEAQPAAEAPAAQAAPPAPVPAAPQVVAVPAPAAPVLTAQPAPPPAPVATPYPYQLPPPIWLQRPAQEPQGYVLPPLPAGYVYVPTPIAAQPPAAAPAPIDVARNAQLYDELRLIDDRLDTLHRDPIRVGGPIAMMVLGYGTTLVGVAATFGSYGAAKRIERGELGRDDDDHDDLDFNDDGQVNGRDEQLFRRTARISSGVAAAGLVLGILGTTRLVQRRHEQKARKQEVGNLTQRRDNLRSQLDFGAGFAPGQVSASVRGRY